uniref:Uncharacterized protein n=1 Tax=Kalanchoe fedtschenkoi TaxID=63787 RepID=A0A7N0ULM4_KALFE
MRRVADINLRGESEDPLFEKSRKSGYMTGSLSTSICHLDSLTTLVIADWKGISGSIPTCIPSSLPTLRILNLIGNSFSGPIPSDIGALSKLKSPQPRWQSPHRPWCHTLVSNPDAGSPPPQPHQQQAIPQHTRKPRQHTRMLSRALLGRNDLSGPIPTSISSLNRLADLELRC